jgi:hypothetical protein
MDNDVADPEELNGIAEPDEFTPEGYDEYIGAQIMVPLPDGRIQGKIVKRANKMMAIRLGGGMIITSLTQDDTK